MRGRYRQVSSRSAQQIRCHTRHVSRLASTPTALIAPGEPVMSERLVDIRDIIPSLNEVDGFYQVGRSRRLQRSPSARVSGPGVVRRQSNQRIAITRDLPAEVV